MYMPQVDSILCMHVFFCSIYSKDPLLVNRVYDHLLVKVYPVTKNIVHLL